MKELVKVVIDFIDRIYTIIKQAYDDTWSDEILADEFNDRVKEIQEDNRAKYIGFAAGVFTHKAAKKGVYLPESQALRLAHKSFIDSVLNDELDELYNVKGEGNESDK